MVVDSSVVSEEIVDIEICIAGQDRTVKKRAVAVAFCIAQYDSRIDGTTVTINTWVAVHHCRLVANSRMARGTLTGIDGMLLVVTWELLEKQVRNLLREQEREEVSLRCDPPA